MSKAVMKRILGVLAKRNILTNMTDDLSPEEVAQAQYHIGVSLCETFKECDMDNKEIIFIMQYLYELPPFTARQISDEMFDISCGKRRINKITPTMISKKYMPTMTKSGLIEVQRTTEGKKYKLNGYGAMLKQPD